MDGTVILWDAETGKQIRTFQPSKNPGPVSSVVFDPTGKFLIFAAGPFGKQSLLHVREIATGKEPLKIKGPRLVRLGIGSPVEHGFSQINQLGVSPDGQRLTVGSNDNGVWAYDLKTRKPFWVFSEIFQPFDHLAFHPKGKMMAGATPDQLIVWKVEDRKTMWTQEAHVGPVRALAYSPDGERLVTGGLDRQVKVWDPTSGKLLRTLDVEQRVVAIAFHPNGNELAVGMGKMKAQGTVKIFDVTTGEETLRIDGLPNGITSVRFHPKGWRLILATWKPILEEWIFPLPTGEEKQEKTPTVPREKSGGVR